MKRRLPALHLISDGQRVGEAALEKAIASAVDGGLEWVQLREKHLPDEEFRRLASRYRRRFPRVSWIANRRAEIVRDLDLAGVHLGDDPATIAATREVVGASRWIGYSAHSESEAREAFASGADYVYLSPVFPPKSKPASGEVWGLRRWSQACAALPPGVFALGGVGPESVPALRLAGAAGVAVIASILDADRPDEATRAHLEAWERAHGKSSP